MKKAACIRLCCIRVSRVKMLEDLLTYMKSRPGTLIGPGKVIADAARKALMPEA